MKRFNRAIFAALAAALLGSCEWFPGLEGPESTGSLVISFGESGESRASVPSAETLATLRYDLALTGPDGQKIAGSLTVGEAFKEQVALGEWEIYAEAYTPEEALIGRGKASVTVKAGTNRARVPMYMVQDTTVNGLDLTGLVTAPVKDQPSDTKPINAAQYKGTVTWQTANGADFSGNFAAGTIYKAAITLTAKTGYTFSGVAANSFTFTYSGAAVTNATGSGVAITVIITFPITEGSVPGETPDNPLPMEKTININTGWAALLNEIRSAGQYVALDLSDCTMDGISPEFDPGTADTGERFIVSLVLPDTAVSVKGGSVSSPTFQYFTNLKSFSAANIRSIGDWAFSCVSVPNTTLEKVSLPATLTTISVVAFSGCSNLNTIEVDFANPVYKGQGGMLLNKAGDTLIMYPGARGTVELDSAIKVIGESAFSICIDLETVSLPEVTSIGTSAFWQCSSLKTVSLPKVTSIGNSAFNLCSALETVSFPAVTGIGHGAFFQCTALKTVSLPVAESIGRLAFYMCNALETASLPAVTSIDSNAFAGTGSTALAITLGGTAPTLGYDMFQDVTGPKTVTVKRPAAASAYGPSPANSTDNNWGNAFRGRGWDGKAYLGHEVNGNISLIIENSE
jgi:hypothetical protein